MPAAILHVQSLFTSVQGVLLLALGAAALGLGGFAFADALRHDPQVYAVEGKRTKGFWVGILAVGLAILVISVPQVLNMFALLAVVAAGVYLADVRPALQPHTQRRRRQQGRAGGSGPHGSW